MHMQSKRLYTGEYLFGLLADLNVYVETVLSDDNHYCTFLEPCSDKGASTYTSSNIISLCKPLKKVQMTLVYCTDEMIADATV